jgi:hypothetical protein
LLLTLAPAIAVAAIPGAAQALRSRLSFALTPYAGSIGEVLSIAASNARVVVAIALAAWVRSRQVALGPTTDVLVGLVVVANTTLVGIAVGAYGAASLPWLIHLPLEWTALAVVLVLHRPHGQRTRHTAACAVAAAVSLAFVGVGAFVETYLTPQQ